MHLQLVFVLKATIHQLPSWQSSTSDTVETWSESRDLCASLLFFCLSDGRAEPRRRSSPVHWWSSIGYSWRHSFQCVIFSCVHPSRHKRGCVLLLFWHVFLLHLFVSCLLSLLRHLGVATGVSALGAREMSSLSSSKSSILACAASGGYRVAHEPHLGGTSYAHFATRAQITPLATTCSTTLSFRSPRPPGRSWPEGREKKVIVEVLGDLPPKREDGRDTAHGKVLLVVNFERRGIRAVANGLEHHR